MSAIAIDDLQLTLPLADGGRAAVLRGASLAAEPGHITGLVGESGSGKSLTALACLGLLPAGAQVRGSIRVGAVEMVDAPPRTAGEVRGRRLAMIFQNPAAALNPFFTIGAQIEAVFARVGGGGPSRAERTRRVAACLERVQLPAAAAARYPHQMSGGQLQRAMIALAVACRPQLLIADEPTTALDVTVQARILALLGELTRDGLGLLLITHDLALIAQTATVVHVMYAGRVVESGATARVFARPAHPYTAGLLTTLPRLGGGRRRLAVIPGRVPSPAEHSAGCAFRSRCPRALPACATPAAPGVRVWSGRRVECINPLVNEA